MPETDALERLTRDARAGKPAAMSELGHRLLVGDGAPLQTDLAVGLIMEASDRGDTRAKCRLAALTAAGALVPVDLPAAMRLLAEAADAGDPSARGQLECLQPDEVRPANGLEMAARVPLENWLRPAATLALHEKVHRVLDLAPPRVCAWLIGRARGRLAPARVYDSVSHQEMVHEMRTNTAAHFDFASFDVVQFLLQARMALTCGLDVSHFEAPVILHYDPGQQITPHFDFIDKRAVDYERQIREQGQRVITFLCYLNDTYGEGKTTFPELGVFHRGRCGEGMYFINAHPDGEPDRSMLHTGSPPSYGEKWIVSQFVRHIAVRP